MAEKVVKDVSSTDLLFAKPAPYRDAGEVKKTIVLVSDKDDHGNSVISHVCVEDKMKDIINLSYQETTLSTLVDKGISPKSLAIIDTQKLGCDVGVDQLANYIMDHASEFVVTLKTDEK